MNLLNFVVICNIVNQTLFANELNSSTNWFACIDNNNIQPDIQHGMNNSSVLFYGICNVTITNVTTNFNTKFTYLLCNGLNSATNDQFNFKRFSRIFYVDAICLLLLIILSADIIYVFVLIHTLKKNVRTTRYIL